MHFEPKKALKSYFDTKELTSKKIFSESSQEPSITVIRLKNPNFMSSLRNPKSDTMRVGFGIIPNSNLNPNHIMSCLRNPENAECVNLDMKILFQGSLLLLIFMMRLIVSLFDCLCLIYQRIRFRAKFDCLENFVLCSQISSKVVTFRDWVLYN